MPAAPQASLSPEAIVASVRNLLGDEATPDLLKPLNEYLQQATATRHGGTDRSVRDRILDRRRDEKLGLRSRLRALQPVETLEVPLSSIVTANIENCRETVEEADYRMLVNTMGSIGQINPLSVVRDARRPDRFVLISGFRRLRAAAELGWKEIRVSVFNLDSARDCYLFNTFENISRSDLSTYEKARRFKLFKEKFGMCDADIAKEFSCSDKYVHMLVHWLELPEPILDDWRQRHRLLTTSMLQKLSSPSTPDPLTIWERLRTRHAREEARNATGLTPLEQLQQMAAEQSAKEDDGSDGHSAYRKPSRARLISLRDVLSRARLPNDREKFRELLLDVVDFCRGSRPSIRGVVFSSSKQRRPPPSALQFVNAGVPCSPLP